jgi:transcription initiation factor TFIIIB Brf1 subunit/transcription initiation factor TFIIB
MTFLIDPIIYGIIMSSYPSIEIVCGKCGCIINKIINLKSIKDVLRSSNGRCNTCGIQLNPTEFTVKTEKH